jgi:hypothetical protein
MPENATSPIFVPSSCLRMNRRAASLAAVSRLGSTSVEHIEFDTSIVSRIDVADVGTAADTCGRATPAPSTSRPATNRMIGILRRHSVRPGSAAWISATLDRRTATRRRRRFSHHRTRKSSGTTSTAVRAQGQVRDIRRPFRTSGSSAARRS